MTNFTATCHGKIGYPGSEDARAQVRRLKRAGKAPAADRLTVYRCPTCELWHVGHDPKGARSGRDRLKSRRNLTRPTGG